MKKRKREQKAKKKAEGLIVSYIVLPETPWFYGRKENKEKAFKSMRRLYHNIPEYDYEEEWGVIVRTIAHEKEELAKAKQRDWKEIFTGLNGVGFKRCLFSSSCVGIELTYPLRNACSSC